MKEEYLEKGEKKMSNPLSDTQVGNKFNNFGNMFNNFMQNPMQFLSQRKINVPQEYANDPHGAVQHLLNSGKMSQDQLNRLTQIAGQMGIKLQ